MGSVFAVAAGMRTFGLLLTLLTVTPQATTDQKLAVPEGTVITSAQVTGFDVDRLSPGLRDAIRDLAGTPLKQERLDELARRIEAERPRYVAAVRTVMEPGGEARVFFLVGRQEQVDRDQNINARYVVEQADITGVPDAEVPQAIRDDLQALAGKRLDSPEADRLQDRLERELTSYDVSRRIQRGSETGRIRLVYEAHKKELPNWLPFERLRSNALYHSEHGWGTYLDLGIGDRNIRFTPIVAIDNSDDLIEEYTGYGLRFEARKLGTRRLGASLEWSSFDQDWETATLETLTSHPEIPGTYSSRSTFTPLLKFAFSPDLSISAGVSIAELDPFVAGTQSHMANAGVASLAFDRQWRGTGPATHTVDANFGMRFGARNLQSDFSYNRYLGDGWYRFDYGRHHIQATGMAGQITGQAPLFERFTLGDSKTLRGWDKYDVAPAGGDRLLYSSVEYRYTGVGLFLDVGSVGTTDSERRARVSTGFSFHAGPAFLVVGFPLNTDKLTAIVAFGLRIPGAGTRW